MENTDFKSRLEKVVGEERPFSFAKRAGITGAAFSDYWNESKIPKSEILRKISEASGYSIHWLLTGEGPEKVGGAVQELSVVLSKDEAAVNPPEQLVNGCTKFCLMIKINHNEKEISLGMPGVESPKAIIWHEWEYEDLVEKE